MAATEKAMLGCCAAVAHAAVLALLFLSLPPALRADEPPLLTVAEKSDFQATSRHADVVDFCERLAKRSPVVRLGELGTSSEGRKLPLLILADPPVATPEEAARGGKLVVFVMANIHAGEVDGKEGVLMLARDIATAKERPLLKDLVLVIVPDFNADGNERIARTNRTTQNGPAEGVGVRTNAQGFDLNRDYVKLESPEVRSLVRFFNRWDPAVVVDCHTTDGSFHRYTLTYEGGRCPAGDERVVTYVRDTLLPEVGKRLEKETGYLSYFYGNFSAGRARWVTVPPTPRYGSHYVGLRNRIGILSESYTYAPYKDRVLASRGFVKGICEYAAANRDKIDKLLSEARRDTVRAGKDLKDSDRVVPRSKPAPVGRPHPFLGYVEEVKNGRRVSTGQPKEYEVTYWGGAEPTLSVRRPFAYLVPAGLAHVVENLQRHGAEVEELREDVELDVEAYRIDKVTHDALFQKHQPTSVEATPRKESRRVAAGTLLVRTAQPLGSLAAYLLEPQSEDGLVTWNFLDDALKEGGDFPVLRLPAAAPLTTGRARPLPDGRPRNKPLTFEAVYGAGRPLSFAGSPVSGLVWLDDGEHFLQVKEGRLYRVDARSGRCDPFYDPDRLARGLAALPAVGADAARSLARALPLNLNAQRTGALFVHDGDLYFAHLDGTGAVRLTKTPGTKELATFSPDGKFVAFVRDGNLFVVDVATQTERALTTDGGGLVRNGKADWVYGEEILNRHAQEYWWSPDSTRLAFLRIDDAGVRQVTLVDQSSARLATETAAYPKAGERNPAVKLGIVAAGGGPVAWVEPKDYPETSTLLVRAGWTPDGRHVYFYCQDRAQTWLDVCLAPRDGGEATRLLRDTTQAWVDEPGELTFLKDGSFLLASERTGWRHLYHYAKDGKLLRPVTGGAWEVTALDLADEDSGWLYFTATGGEDISPSLYRMRLEGGDRERLTSVAGEHHVSVGPKGKLFLDTWSGHTTPTQVRVYATDGTPVRTVDTNPVYAREEYRFGEYERVRIKTPDGWVLEGDLLKPPDFEPHRRYPVWFETYAGPHAPVVHDSWMGGRVSDEVKAQRGFLVFRCDPRSASGKGACSAWTAYRKLGVQELADIETAIRWLEERPYVDATRVGMSGHSYGGFMTAYALTHSKLFAAGIAGAPVTDWRNYDTIYTERYMRTPQDNPDGYNATSVVRAAAHLHGKLLLVHGLMDDNVHLQNSVELVDALQRADRDFEMMFYPRARHPILGRHYQRLLLDFMVRTLHPEGARETTSRPTN
jgi:dipeptidyl aminopeptidase/acylaminoacyl peptidase